MLSVSEDAAKTVILAWARAGAGAKPSSKAAARAKRRRREYGYMDKRALPSLAIQPAFYTVGNNVSESRLHAKPYLVLSALATVEQARAAMLAAIAPLEAETA